MADSTMLDIPIDTSWVTPMGKRAKVLIEKFNSEDPDVKADAAEQIMLVGEAMEAMSSTGAPLTEAQQAIMDLYNKIKAEQVNQ